MRHLLLLSDSIQPWHSVWIRIGQYADLWPYRLHPSVWITKNHRGEIQGVNAKSELTPPCDGILLYRWTPKSGSAEWLIEAIRAGLPLIADVDDNLWQASGSWSHERLRCFTRIIKEADAITCSSMNLKCMLQAMFKEKNIVLIKNSGPDSIRAAKQKAKTIRIGWTGAPWTRENDLNELKALTHWLRGVKNTQLVHVGHDPNRPTMAEILDLPTEAVETHPLMPYRDYLKHLDFDIGLAPLTRNNFNNYKSDLKVVEYSSQGIAWIASSCDPYEDLCSEWGLTGRLCTKATDWIQHCEELLTQNKYREEGKILKSICHGERSKTIAAQVWQTLIEEVLIKKNNGSAD